MSFIVSLDQVSYSFVEEVILPLLHNVFVQTSCKLLQTIQNLRRGLLTDGVCLLHDYTRSHTTIRTRELVGQIT